MQKVLPKDDLVLALTSSAEASVTAASRPLATGASPAAVGTSMPLLCWPPPALLVSAAPWQALICLADVSTARSGSGGRCMFAGSFGPLCCPFLFAAPLLAWQLPEDRFAAV